MSELPHGSRKPTAVNSWKSSWGRSFVQFVHLGRAIRVEFSRRTLRSERDPLLGRPLTAGPRASPGKELGAPRVDNAPRPGPFLSRGVARVGTHGRTRNLRS